MWSIFERASATVAASLDGLGVGETASPGSRIDGTSELPVQAAMKTPATSSARQDRRGYGRRIRSRVSDRSRRASLTRASAGSYPGGPPMRTLSLRLPMATLLAIVAPGVAAAGGFASSGLDVCTLAPRQSDGPEQIGTILESVSVAGRDDIWAV